MPKKTSVKVSALSALTPLHKKHIRSHACHMAMEGSGFSEIMKSVGDYLGPIIKEVGPMVIQNYLLPFIKKKLAGQGLTLAGQGLSPAGGDGLKLAGQGFKKGTPEAHALMAKARASRKGKKAAAVSVATELVAPTTSKRAHLVKGSAEAKAYMAKLRAMRK